MKLGRSGCGAAGFLFLLCAVSALSCAVIEARALTSDLEQDNAMLRGKVARLEERMAVMERIATDAPGRLSAEIEKLRD